ncbi:MAG TPA: alginate lyase family protein [Candidatus Angelobacter sp.]
MNCLLGVALYLAACQPLQALKPTADPLPRVFLLDAGTLAQQKQCYAADANNALATAVRDAADRAMKEGLFSVMDKPVTPPSGDKHDYMSLGTYWWPNPKTANGLPYIRHDGERNPGIEKIPDHENMGRVGKNSRLLALAFYVTGDEAYAVRAALLLRTWFLDPATRMNPNLNFGQGIPGITTGRGTGIIDSRGLTDVVDAIGLLAGSRNWKADDQKGMERWFAGYLAWLQQSSIGQDEAKAANNHGTFYDVQVADFALFNGKPDVARDVVQQAKEKRLARQIMPDGSQPLEAERTRGLSYSLFNLEGLMELAELGEHTGVDLWNFQTSDGRSICRALEYLLPFARGEKKWEHQQITEFKPQEIVPRLLMAASKFSNPEYERAAQKLGMAERDVNNLLLQAELHR